MSKSKRYRTIGEKLFWSYANLAMAHAALDAGAESYGPRWYQVRNYMWTRFKNEEFKPRTLVDDEKIKLRSTPFCAYCGSQDELTADHLIPAGRGGPDVGDNLVRACRSCNSSKGDRDLMEWYLVREEFPPLLIFRRYLKQCIELARDAGILEHPLDESIEELPFSITAVPTKLPPPKALKMQTEARFN